MSSEQLPDLDQARALGYNQIRYVAGYPESYVKEYALAYAQAALLAKEAECEALMERVVWAMDNMGLRNTHADFVAHVLRRGGTGDYSDCATFIDAALVAAKGAK